MTKDTSEAVRKGEHYSLLVGIQTGPAGTWKSVRRFSESEKPREPATSFQGIGPQALHPTPDIILLIHFHRWAPHNDEEMGCAASQFASG